MQPYKSRLYSNIREINRIIIQVYIILLFNQYIQKYSVVHTYLFTLSTKYVFAKQSVFKLSLALLRIVDSVKMYLYVYLTLAEVPGTVLPVQFKKSNFEKKIILFYPAGYPWLPSKNVSYVYILYIHIYERRASFKENRIYIRVEFRQSLGMHFVSPFQPERELKVYSSCKLYALINFNFRFSIK